MQISTFKSAIFTVIIKLLPDEQQERCLGVVASHFFFGTNLQFGLGSRTG